MYIHSGYYAIVTPKIKTSEFESFCVYVVDKLRMRAFYLYVRTFYMREVNLRACCVHVTYISIKHKYESFGCGKLMDTFDYILVILDLVFSFSYQPYFYSDLPPESAVQ